MKVKETLKLKVKKATSAILFVALVFSLVVPLHIFVSSVRADSDWLEGWQYRKSHVIQSVSGAGTNYQVIIVVHYGNGTDYNDNTKKPPEGHVYLNGHCKSDFSDVRFTDDDKVTLLDYWIETCYPEDNATFWVEIADDLSSSDVTIYIYYGNSDATSLSNGEDTFILFDDWEDGQDHVGSKWTVTYSRPTTLGGSHSVVTDGNVKALRFFLDTDSTSRVFKSTSTIPDGFALRCRAKMLQGGTKNVFTLDTFPRFQDPDNFERAWYHCLYEEYRINKRVSASTTLLGQTGTDSYPWNSEYNVYHIYESQINGLKFRFLRDGTQILSSSSGWDTSDKPIAFGAARWSGGNAEVYYDWVFVRKWVDPEPSHGSWGIEETSSEAPTEEYTTLYFVNEQHTIYGMQAYKLNETNSDTHEYVSRVMTGGSFQVWVAVRVFLRHSDESEDELTDGNYKLNVTRTGDGSGIQTIEWQPAGYITVNSGDALVIRVYLKVGTQDWALYAKFATDPFSSDIDISEIIFRLWTERSYYTDSIEYTEVRFYWGSETYNSRIEYSLASLPPVSRFVDGKSVVGGRQHIYYNGCKEAIYVVYCNTSFSPWKYQVRCFDMESYQWIGPFNISDVPQSDTHYRPSISVLPDGRLIVMYCFYEPFTFRISQYSADSESNLTKLCSNWSEEYSVNLRWQEDGCYPHAVRTENYTFVLLKESGTSGNIAYLHFAVNNWIYSYVESFDNSTYVGSWTFEGSSPYVDEYGLRSESCMKAYGYTADHYAQIGNFTFRSGWAENIDGTAYLEILAESQGASICTSWNTTWLDVSGGNPTWLRWKVNGKNWSDTLNYIKVYSENNYNTTIYCVRLKLNITGCSPSIAFIDPPAGCSAYFFYPRKFGDKIIVYGTKWQSGVGRYNFYFVYSEDEGFTWKVANGTEVKIPIPLEEIKAVNIGGSGTYNVWNKGGIIYNNTAILLALPFKYNVKNWSHPLVLIYYDNLGSPEGEWHIVNATFTDGTPIWMPSGFFGCNLIYDEYYDRPSIWFEAGDKIVKAVATSYNFTVYRIIYEDEQFINAQFGFSLIHYSPEAYEVAGDNLKFLFGYPHIGEGNQTMATDVAYGCKFNATQSGYLTKLYIYQNPPSQSSTNVYIKAAIYDENLTLISVSDTIKWVTGKTFYGWGYPITFPDPPYIVENETYWIVFKVDVSDKVGYAYTTGATNQTIEFPNAWENAFPSQIDVSEATFYNRKISLYGGEVRLVVRGLGHDTYPPYPTNIGVQGTPTPEGTVTFHAYWIDGSHLDYAVFYWNASGTMQENGTLEWTDKPSEAWSNFTRVLPPNSQGWKIAWYIIAYDVYGNSKNTSIQILNVCMLYSLTVNEELSFDVERKVEVLISRISALTISDDSLKSLGITVSELFNAFICKFEGVSLIFTQILDFAHSAFKNIFKFPFETLAVKDCSSKAFVKFSFQSLGFSEKLLKHMQIFRAETLKFPDTVSFNIYILLREQIIDKLNLQDLLLKNIRILTTEKFGLQDLMNKLVCKLQAEQVYILDEQFTGILIVVKEQVIHEFVKIGDRIFKFLVIIKAEPLTLPETATKNIRIFRSDGLSLLDQTFKRIGPFFHEKVVSEMAGFKDLAIIQVWTPWYNDPAEFMKVILFGFCIGLFIYWIAKRL